MGRKYCSVEGAAEEASDLDSDGHGDLLYGYSHSKRQAEKLVLAANSDSLSTCALKPVGIYGEGDRIFVPTFIKFGKRFFSIMPHLGSPEARIQRIYVGNAAWAHVCALNTLLHTEDDRHRAAAGQSYMLTDDTVINSHFQFMKPFIESHSIKVLPVSVPLWLVVFLLWLLELLLWVLSPLVKIQLPFTKEGIFLAGTTCYYNGDKARRLLNYYPKYSQKESYQRSFQYYRSLNLNTV